MFSLLCRRQTPPQTGRVPVRVEYGLRRVKSWFTPDGVGQQPFSTMATSHGVEISSLMPLVKSIGEKLTPAVRVRAFSVW